MDDQKLVRTFKFRLYPSQIQQKILEQHFFLCAEVYNTLLSVKFEEGLSLFDLQKETLRDLKICNSEFGQVHSQVLQEVARRVTKSFENYQNRKQAGIKPAGKPRYKSENSVTSITYPQSGFKIENQKLSLSKIGLISIKKHRQIGGKIKTLTIKKEKTGKWYACFATECNIIKKKHPHQERVVGLDAGLTNLLATSEEELIENKRFLIDSERKINRLQMLLSKKYKGSNNWQKARIKLAKRHEKVKNQRDSYLHLISKKLVGSYDIIIAEDLPIKKMMQSSYLAKSVSDASWGKLFRMIEYKAESAGTQFIQINPRGTSQICLCGAKVKKTLKERIHSCPQCGIKEDRDIHSSKILVDRYRRNYGNSSLTELFQAGKAMTQETTNLRSGSSQKSVFN